MSEKLISIQVTNFVESAVYWYMGLRPTRIEQFTAGSVKVFYQLTRTERDEISARLIDPEAVLYLKAFIDGVKELTTLIEKSKVSGVYQVQ